MGMLNLRPLRIGWPPMRLGAGAAPDPTVPDMIPSVRLVEATPDSMLIAWDQPYDGGSPITRYILQYRPVSGGSYITINPAVSPQPVEGLDADTAYHVRARADNALGNGPVAPPTTLPTPA